MCIVRSGCDRLDVIVRLVTANRATNARVRAGCDFSKLEPPISIAERLGFNIDDWPPARTRTANFVRLTAVALAVVVTARHVRPTPKRRASRES